MNIGFVLIPYQHYSGVGEYYRNLFEHLIAIDKTNTYTIFLPCDAGEAAYDFFGRERCVLTKIPSFPSHLRYPKTMFQDDTIEAYRPRIDVLHCFNFPIPRFSGKIVMTVHDMREDDLPQFFNPVINRIRRQVVQNNLYRADAIIAVSDFTLERLLYHYPFCLGKAKRVYHGIRDGINQNKKLIPQRLHAGPYILTVGHMYPYKSQRNLLLAFNRLIKRPDIPYNLVVVGGSYFSQAYYQDIRNIVEDKERVVFTGTVTYEQLSSYYAYSDLLVFPSLYEGFGFPLFEALSYGLPVAVSDIDVFNELLECPEATFNPNDPESIEATIYKILKNPEVREAILRQGEKRLATLTWSNTAKETLVIYEKAAQDQKKNQDLPVIVDFGREWKRYDQSNLSEEEAQILFDGYFSNFPWEILPEKPVGFDLGCGTGRWAVQVSPRVHELYCIEPSPEALRVAKKNLRNYKNCRFVNATTETMPISDGSMDFGYALGVLHHVTDVEGALNACVAKLKPGAPLLVYIYYALENRSFKYIGIWKI
ncbi:MAG: glycosyltransferase, partial [Syntrophales bacterium LBB04]|nr:glycosyltransferase [Syntrophales bacterium LBB04]